MSLVSKQKSSGYTLKHPFCEEEHTPTCRVRAEEEREVTATSGPARRGEAGKQEAWCLGPEGSR